MNKMLLLKEEELNRLKSYKIDGHSLEIETYNNCSDISKIWWNYNNNMASIPILWNGEKKDFAYNSVDRILTSRQKKILLARIKKVYECLKEKREIIKGELV